MEAPRLPTTETELAEWSVYADYLQTRGDPRGELIAYDLALSATPERAEVEAFHALARGICKRRRATPIGWCLGYARTLQLPPGRRWTMRWSSETEDGLLANIAPLLRDPALARLQAIELAYEGVSRHWRRVFDALPATCERIDVLLGRRVGPDAIDALLALLPPTVRELRLSGGHEPLGVDAARFVSDRFAVVDVGAATLDAAGRAAFAAAHATTHTVELRFASPGDAAVIAGGSTLRLARWTMYKLQDRFGVIGVRAQLAGSLPEGHEIDRYLRTRPMWAGAHLVRRGSRWTLRSSRDAQIWIGDRELDGIAEIHDGDTFAIRHTPPSERVECRFVARDVT